jgi:multidrug resistance efflux pump
MSSGVTSVSVIRGALWLGLCALAAGVYASRSEAPLAEQIQQAVGAPATTALPARISPGSQSDLVSEVMAEVVSVHRQPGDVVEAGELLLVLENRELSSQAEAAQKRLGAAAAHAAPTGSSRWRASGWKSFDSSMSKNRSRMQMHGCARSSHWSSAAWQPRQSWMRLKDGAMKRTASWTRFANIAAA